MSLEISKLTETDTLSVNFVKEQMAELNWKFGLNDVECCTVFSDPGLCIAKLNGRPVGCVCFNKYDNSYWTAGMYIVDKKHRGKGYGMQIFQTAMKEVDLSQNISGYSVPEMIEQYNVRFGFQSHWLCAKFECQLMASIQNLQSGSTKSKALTTKSIQDCKEEDLVSYDTAVFGYDRKTFILKWLHSTGSHVKVVVDTDNSGGIVGYAAARPCYGENEGYCLGPLFADSQEAAQELLKALFEDIINHRESASCESIIVYGTFPTGRNTKSKDLMELLQGKRGKEDLIYMTNNGIPRGCFEKWFAVTSTEM